MNDDPKSDLSSVEDRVAQIWSRELRGTVPAKDDDFWMLGGESFNVVNMTYAIEKEFGVDLPADAIFNHSTLSAFSQLLFALIEQAAEDSGRTNPGTERTGTI